MNSDGKIIVSQTRKLCESLDDKGEKLGAKKMHHENLRLREPVTPTDELLEQVLSGSYAAYEVFQEALPKLEIEQEWQWFPSHKVWGARGWYNWTTLRGTRKEKTLYWLYVYEEYFTVSVWFKEKNRMEALKINVSEKTKQLILNAKTFGKLPTFPVIFDVTTIEPLADIYTLIDCKKRIEG